MRNTFDMKNIFKIILKSKMILVETVQNCKKKKKYSAKFPNKQNLKRLTQQKKKSVV